MILDLLAIVGCDHILKEIRYRGRQLKRKERKYLREIKEEREMKDEKELKKREGVWGAWNQMSLYRHVTVTIDLVATKYKMAVLLKLSLSQ